jgi:hypothetical protein
LYRLFVIEHGCRKRIHNQDRSRLHPAGFDAPGDNLQSTPGWPAAEMRLCSAA